MRRALLGRALLALALLLPLAASAQEGFPIGPGPGQIPGTATNDNACTGCVGQPITASGSAVALTSNVTANIASTSLTAGDWMVFGNFGITTGASANTAGFIGGISTTSATLPAGPACRLDWQGAALGASVVTLTAFAPCHLQLASTTTVYLAGYALYAGSGLTGSGSYVAIRIR